MPGIKNVTLVGASGDLGATLLFALVSAGHFRVTVLKRASSTSTLPSSLPSSVRIVTVSDTWDLSSLTEALRGEDAVVASFRVPDPPTPHLILASAAAEAGVRRYVPADFGSVDAQSESARKLVPLFERKLTVQRHLEGLTEKHEGLSWTSLVCGHFFDWGLKEGFLHIDLLRRKADVLGDGNQKSSLSTLTQVGRGLVAVLTHSEEEIRNKRLFIQSFCVSQNEVLESLERVTGREWKRESIATEEFVAKYKKMLEEGDRFAVEDLVFALGVMEGDWEKKEDFAVKLLGLEQENLDEVVRKVVGEHEEELKAAREAGKARREEAEGKQAA